MSSKIVKFSFTPGENEQIEATIKLPQEHRSVIHGTVKDHKNRNVKDAVVKLFEVLSPQEDCWLKPITYTFTDECGQFLFGPLTACKQYVIKIWFNHVKIRELVICPDDFNDACEEKYKEHKKSSCIEAHQACIGLYEEEVEESFLEDKESE